MPYERAGTSKKKDKFPKKPAKSIRIDKLTNATKPKGFLHQRFNERELFWIQTLQTLHPKVLNQELST